MPRLPFPAISGRKTSLYHYCRILSEELGYRIVVAAFLEDGDNPELKPDFIDRLVLLKSEASIKKLWNIFTKSFLTRKMPMQVSLFLSTDAQKEVNTIFLEEKPFCVIADMVRCTEYIKDLPAYRIADLDDLISIRYQRQLDSGEDSNPYGAFINFIPSCFRKVLLSDIVKKFVLKNEIKLMKHYESKIAEKCDKTILVAKAEAECINNLIEKSKAVDVPIGVDTNYFSPSNNQRENVIGFLGTMNVSHNEAAVKHFLKDIYPTILDSVPDSRFMVVGGGVRQELKQLENDHIIFTGRVEDVRDYLKQCKVFVCPMTYGSGIKTKNLEAMAMGLPIVTTSIGAENIDAIDGLDWIVENDDDKFASAVVNILTGKISVGNSARQYVCDNWSWSRSREKLGEIMDEALQ